MKTSLKKILLFLLILTFSLFAFAADEKPEEKLNTGLKFEVADAVKDGSNVLRIKVSGTPKSEAVQSGKVVLNVPKEIIKTDLSTSIPVEMENSTYDIQDPRATLEEPLYIYGVKGTAVDASSVILSDNFKFKAIAPNTDISSWIKFVVGLNADGTKKYVYANELDTDKNKGNDGNYIIPRGLKYEVDELGTEEGEDYIGIHVYGTPEDEVSSRSIGIDLPTNIVVRANPYSVTSFPVSGDTLELSGIVVSNVKPVLKDPEPIIGTAYFPLSKEYTFSIMLDFKHTDGKYPTFTGLSADMIYPLGSLKLLRETVKIASITR